MRIPTPGRIVLYRPTAAEQSACGEHPEATVQVLLPAIVISANQDGNCNLRVFQDSPQDLYVTRAPQGQEPGQWNWPLASPATEGQQAAKESLISSLSGSTPTEPIPDSLETAAQASEILHAEKQEVEQDQPAETQP